MRDLLVIVPSRGRPERLRDMLGACLSLSEAATDIAVACDDDDLYDLREFSGLPRIVNVIWYHGPRAGLAVWTNRLAALYTGRYREFRALGGVTTSPEPRGRYRAFASLGDDHVPRTQGWDRLLLEALGKLGEGIAYGDDRHQGEALPTAPVVSAGIVEALGYMMVPALRHMFVDNAWGDLGRQAGCLAYVPEVVIEHVHPDAGKAVRDGTYEESEAGTAADREAYRKWMRDQLGRDVAKIRALRCRQAGFEPASP